MDPRKDRTTLRQRLYDNGFSPLPNVHKACFWPGWNREAVTPELIAEWDKKRAWKDTGVRCGDVIAIDLDVHIPELVDALADALNKSGIVTESPFARIGREPREMWLYRTSELIGKRTTGAFLPPGAGPDDDDHVQVEVLGRGNQFGAYGMHSSEIEYSWPDLNLLDHKYMELPEITAAQVDAVIAFCKAFFEERNFFQITGGGTNDGHFPHAYDLEDTMRFTVRDMGEMALSEIAQYLRFHEGEVLRCTVEALRPTTQGSYAGIVSLVGDDVCLSDFGDQIAHYKTELDPANNGMAKLGKLLEERFPGVFDTPELPSEDDYVVPAPEDLQLDPLGMFDENLEVALQRFVYVGDTDEIRDLLLPGSKYTPRHLNTFLNQFYRAEQTQRGNDRITFLASTWLQHAHRLNVKTAGLRPDKPAPFFVEDGQRHFNTYYPRELPTHGNPDVGLDFLRMLVPDPGEQRWFMQWVAHKVLHPYVRGPGVIMVARDNYGTGRGSLIALLADMFSNEYVRTVSFSTLTGKNYQSQYNEWMSNSLIVAVDEAHETTDRGTSRWQHRHTAYEHLKTIVDPGYGKMEVLRKGVANYQGETFCSMIVATNHSDAIVIPVNDRRLGVLENGKPQPPEYWAAFHAWRADLANVGAFREALKVVDLEGFNPYVAPPMTRAKLDMIDSGTSDLDRAVALVLDRAAGRVMVKEQLLVHMETLLIERVMELPEGWREIAGAIFLKLTRKPKGSDLLKFPDNRVRTIRVVGDGEPPPMPTEEAVLEEVNKNGPLTRVLNIGGAKIIDLPTRAKR